MMKRVKCVPCINLLVKSKQAPVLEIASESGEGEYDATKEQFLKSINRGGLVTPTELVYLVCVHALQLHDELFDGAEIQEKFLATEVPKSSFVALLTKKIENTPASYTLLDQKCENMEQEGHCFHSFVPTIAAKFFNCLSKNFAATLNDSIHAARKRTTETDELSDEKKDPSARKIKKLQSN